MIPGEVFPAEGEIELNAGLPVTELQVANTGDRPVQVGSHYHFAEANPGDGGNPTRILDVGDGLDSPEGISLDIPAGSAMRFEPGQQRTVALVPFGGARRAIGFNQQVMGDLD